jgi:hypothetical protein
MRRYSHTARPLKRNTTEIPGYTPILITNQKRHHDRLLQFTEIIIWDLDWEKDKEFWISAQKPEDFLGYASTGCICICILDFGYRWEVLFNAYIDCIRKAGAWDF